MARFGKHRAWGAGFVARASRRRGMLVSAPQFGVFMSDIVPPSSGPPLPPSAPPPTLAPEDEFAGIRSRAGRHPALALGAAALALFIIFHVRADISYALSSNEPIDLGDAAATFGGGKPGDGARPRAVGVPPETLEHAANRYVTVRGTPDRESALELDTKRSWVFTQFFRILGTGTGTGTGSRLFVHRRE